MGRFKIAFDMTASQALVQSQFQQRKKNQPINVLVCVIRNIVKLELKINNLETYKIKKDCMIV